MPQCGCRCWRSLQRQLSARARCCRPGCRAAAARSASDRVEVLPPRGPRRSNWCDSRDSNPVTVGHGHRAHAHPHRRKRASLTTHAVGTLGADVETSAGAFELAVGGHRRHWRCVGSVCARCGDVVQPSDGASRARQSGAVSGAARHASSATWRGPSTCELGRLGARLPIHAGQRERGDARQPSRHTQRSQRRDMVGDATQRTADAAAVSHTALSVCRTQCQHPVSTIVFERVVCTKKSAREGRGRHAGGTRVTLNSRLSAVCARSSDYTDIGHP